MMKALYGGSLLLGVILLGVGFSACGKSGAQPTNEATKEEPPVFVKVEEVRLSPFQDAISATGIVKAFDDVMIAPEEGGMIKEWKVEKGDRVVKGQIIGLLHDDLLKAAYSAAEAQFKLAELNSEKQEKAYQDQAISELQLKSAEYNRDAAKAQMELARARLDHTRLRSPVDGILDDLYTDVGEMAPPGVPVAHVVNLAKVKIVADVPERNAPHVAVGTPALITVDAFPNDSLVGMISYVGAVLSASNRTFPVEIVIGNPTRKLKPEMIARLRIMRATKDAAIIISENVIQRVDENKLIVYVENGGKAEERSVKIGARQGTKVEITEGLQVGDRLIVSGFQKLINGRRIQIAG
jgi:membrane fusion protein (multidrug efflux system)